MTDPMEADLEEVLDNRIKVTLTGERRDIYSVLKLLMDGGLSQSFALGGNQGPMKAASHVAGSVKDRDPAFDRVNETDEPVLTPTGGMGKLPIEERLAVAVELLDEDVSQG